MSPKYDECDKYGWDTTIYHNHHTWEPRKRMLTVSVMLGIRARHEYFCMRDGLAFYLDAIV